MKASLSWNAVLVLLWSVNNLLEMGGQVGMDSVFGKTGFFWGRCIDINNPRLLRGWIQSHVVAASQI